MLSYKICNLTEQKAELVDLFQAQQIQTTKSAPIRFQVTDKYLKSMKFSLLIVVLVILGNSLLSFHAEAYESPSCFCDGKLYRFCPEHCRRRQSPQFGLNDLLEENLIDKHPDHSYDSGIADIKTPLAAKPLSPVNEEGSIKEENGEIVVHRKVYVTGKPVKHPIIHPIKITVPVTYKDRGVVLDDPDPVFKLKTYTEYETKPETIQVPVVTTIIKPKNIKKNQIIFS